MTPEEYFETCVIKRLLNMSVWIFQRNELYIVLETTMANDAENTKKSFSSKKKMSIRLIYNLLIKFTIHKSQI